MAPPPRAPGTRHSLRPSFPRGHGEEGQQRPDDVVVVELVALPFPAFHLHLVLLVIHVVASETSAHVRPGGFSAARLVEKRESPVGVGPGATVIHTQTRGGGDFAPGRASLRDEAGPGAQQTEQISPEAFRQSPCGLHLPRLSVHSNNTQLRPLSQVVGES